MKMNSSFKLLVLGCVMAALTSCGGSSGGSSKRGETKNGQFVDSFVGGLRYQSGSQVGITGSNGSFSCESGQDVSFFLDRNESEAILLGTVSCRSVISPLDLATNGEANITTDLNNISEEERQRTVNMLRLLQSLDLDRNTDNGISLESTMMTDLMTWIQSSSQGSSISSQLTAILNMDSDSFSSQLDAMMTALNRSGNSVTEAAALAHFEAFRANCTEDSCTVDEETETTPELAEQNVCISGYTLKSSADALANVVDTMNGQILAAFNSSLEISSTLIVLGSDNQATVYRRTIGGPILNGEGIFDNNASVSSFSAQWSYDETNEQINVEDVDFPNQDADYKFTGVTNLGVSSTNMTEESSGSQNALIFSQALELWTMNHNCKVPAQEDEEDSEDEEVIQ